MPASRGVGGVAPTYGPGCPRAPSVFEQLVLDAVLLRPRQPHHVGGADGVGAQLPLAVRLLQQGDVVGRDVALLRGIRQRRAGVVDDATVGIERSEARRVGKEGVRRCRSRWSPYN